MMQAERFVATVEARAGGGIAIRIPFDVAAVWGSKDRHDVTGTVAGHKVRGPLRQRDGAHYLELGPAWCRDGDVLVGKDAPIELAPEGPQIGTMASDLAAALKAEPQARRFFESLATFYRKGFVRWIDGAKRPETRARRIADTVAALSAGKREP
jgi:Bacteriocin-protection, YdeI or OmpD-Associated/Domain of unknown function (DUF1905)